MRIDPLASIARWSSDPALRQLRRDILDRSIVPAMLDLQGIDLRGEDLRGLDFSSSNLSFARFDGSRADGCGFASADLSFGSFVEASLARTNFAIGRLRSSNFAGANLRFASLRDADLFNCILAGCDLRASDVRGALFAMCDLGGALTAGWRTSQAEITVEDCQLSAPRTLRPSRCEWLVAQGVAWGASNIDLALLVAFRGPGWRSHSAAAMVTAMGHRRLKVPQLVFDTMRSVANQGSRAAPQIDACLEYVGAARAAAQDAQAKVYARRWLDSLRAFTETDVEESP